MTICNFFLLALLYVQHEEWETQTKRLKNFIRTKAKPPIYFLPKTHNAATEKKLKETGKVLDGRFPIFFFN